MTEWEREIFTESRENIIDDTPTADLQTALHKFEFLLEKEKDKKILVHCMMGISRSASLVIGHLMKRDGLNYEEAFSKVREARWIVQSNKGFIEQFKRIN